MKTIRVNLCRSLHYCQSITVAVPDDLTEAKIDIVVEDLIPLAHPDDWDWASDDTFIDDDKWEESEGPPKYVYQAQPDNTLPWVVPQAAAIASAKP